MSNARKLIDDLTSVDLLKTWSLIITMLGDHSRHAPASFSGKQIRAILGHIGIKPEATRVALHRLKNDGWIVTTKVGREVNYQLSKEGLSQSNKAYEDVYRETVKYPQGWKLILSKGNELVTFEGISTGINLFKNIYLIPDNDRQFKGQSMELDFNRTEIPEWFEERVVSSKTLEVMKHLLALAGRFNTAYEFPDQMDAVTIRILFLHHWRKMALRENTWAHIWLFNDGPIAQYHRQVISILKKLPNLKT